MYREARRSLFFNGPRVGRAANGWREVRASRRGGSRQKGHEMGWFRRRPSLEAADPKGVLDDYWWKRYGAAMTKDQQVRATVTNRMLADWLSELLAHVEPEEAAARMRESGLPDAAERMMRLLNGDMPIGVAVTCEPNVNVVVRPVGGSYLVTMTEPFVWLVEHFGWLVAATGTYSDADRIIEPVIGYDTAARRLAGWLDEVMRGGRPTQPEESLEPAVMERGLHYFKNAMQFALGHELGHIVLGHCDAPAPRRTDPGVIVPDSTFDRVDELTADQVGAHVVSHAFEPASEAQFFGMILMFEVLDAVEMHAIAKRDPDARTQALRARALATHPHPAVRRESAIRAGLPPELPQPSLPLCDILLDQCDQIRGQQLPRRDGPALQLIEDLTDPALLDQLIEIFKIGQGVRGVRTVDTPRLARLLGGDLDTAAKTVATAARFYLDQLMTTTRVTSARSQLCLGQVYAMYAQEHLHDPANAEALAVEAVVRAAVPEVDEMVSLFVQNANVPGRRRWFDRS